MDWGICRLMTQPAEPAPAPSPHGRAPRHGGSSPARTGSISRAEVSLEASHGETAYGAIVGTPLYMSPEQAHGRHDQLDAKSDQCALGLILFELVALKRPLGGKTLAEVLTQASSGDARAARARLRRGRFPASSAPSSRKASAPRAGRSLRLGRRARRRSAPLPARRRRARAPRFVLAARGPLARPASPGGGAHAARAGRRHPGRRARRCSGGRSARSRRSSARDRAIERLVADVSEQGDRLQVSLLELHDALDMAVAAIGHAFEYGRPDDRPDPVGRRLARRDHRLRAGARRHPRRRSRARRGASRRCRPR